MIDTTEAVAGAMAQYNKMNRTCSVKSPKQDLYDEAQAGIVADRQVLADAGYAIVKVPTIPFPGGHDDEYYYRSAAQKLYDGYEVGGSNVKSCIASILKDVADSLRARKAAQS